MLSDTDKIFMEAALAENGMPIAAGHPGPSASRRLVVRVTPSEEANPVALLAAVRSALSSQGFTLVVESPVSAQPGTA